MNDDEFIKAFIKSGLELREWERDKLVVRLYRRGDSLVRQWRHKESRAGVAGDPPWLLCSYTDRDIANEIRRQLQEECDKAGVEVRSGSRGMFYVQQQSTDYVLTADGEWEMFRPCMFDSRPEGLIAAGVAIVKDQPHD